MKKSHKKAKIEPLVIAGWTIANPAHPVPMPLFAKVEPLVAEEVDESEFEKFKTALFALFKADGQNRQQRLPMKDVNISIFEQTSLTEGQLITCIEKASDLNLVMLAKDVLYFI